MKQSEINKLYYDSQIIKNYKNRFSFATKIDP